MNDLLTLVANLLTLLAIFSALPGAYLTFKRSFIRDFKDQMVDPRNPGGVGVSTVTGTYRLLALIFIGKEQRWLDLFDPTSEINQTKAKTDKGDAFRIFAWFTLTFASSITAGLLRWLLAA